MAIILHDWSDIDRWIDRDTDDTMLEHEQNVVLAMIAGDDSGIATVCVDCGITRCTDHGWDY